MIGVGGGQAISTVKPIFTDHPLLQENVVFPRQAGFGDSFNCTAAPLLVATLNRGYPL